MTPSQPGTELLLLCRRGPQRREDMRPVTQRTWEPTSRSRNGVMYPAPMMFQRESDAERWLALLEADIVRGKWLSPTARQVALGDYADQWVRERQLQPRAWELTGRCSGTTSGFTSAVGRWTRSIRRRCGHSEHGCSMTAVRRSSL